MWWPGPWRCANRSFGWSRFPPAGCRGRRRREDVSEQVGNLVFAGFVAATAYEHLTELPRYLTAAEQRLTALGASSPTRDQRGAEVIGRCEDAYAAACDLAPPGPLPADLDEIGWLLEGAAGRPVRPEPADEGAGVGEAGDDRDRGRQTTARWLSARTAYGDIGQHRRSGWVGLVP